MAAEQPVSPEDETQRKDALKQLLDQADADAMAEGAPDAPNAMAGADMAEAGAMEQQAGELEEAEATEGIDLSPLTEELGATEERAQSLYDAAQEIPKLAGKTPQELADMIAEDFDVLMQLEMVAARGDGGAMGGPPAGEQMAGGPMGMLPGDMMPPEGM